MTDESNFFSLDKPEILPFFFYPRKWSTNPPSGARDYMVLVDRDVSIACRFHVHAPESPSLLLFHGYTRVVSNYDPLAPMYRSHCMNLFVADYRGYGRSGGTPTFSNMVADAHHVFNAFREVLREGGYSSKVFVNGQSLGSVPAIDVAACHGNSIDGLIIEGAFGTMKRLKALAGLSEDQLSTTDEAFPNVSGIRKVGARTLVLHAEADELIPLVETQELFDNAAAEDKRLVVIPGTDHHDIATRDPDLYFRIIEDFVFGR